MTVLKTTIPNLRSLLKESYRTRHGVTSAMHMPLDTFAIAVSGAFLGPTFGVAVNHSFGVHFACNIGCDGGAGQDAEGEEGCCESEMHVGWVIDGRAVGL